MTFNRDLVVVLVAIEKIHHVSDKPTNVKFKTVQRADSSGCMDGWTDGPREGMWH